MKTPKIPLFLALFFMAVIAPISNAFSVPNATTKRQRQTIALKSQTNDSSENEETVQLGSEEYYKGFVSRSLDEEPVERVTGDAILGPTFKFVGGFAVLLVALFVGFMASNGLL